MPHRVDEIRGGIPQYRDRKRYWWLLSFTVPAVPIVSIYLYFLTEQNPAAPLYTLLVFFVLVPLLDMWLGEDMENPPVEALEAMEEDPYFRRLLHIAVPLYWLGFAASVWFVGTQELPWWSLVLMAIGTGYSSGTALTVGHELGHKNNRVDRFMAIVVNALTGYGHFCIEHNKGHHTWVATPEDIASARFNESIYRFAMREIPGAIKRGWAHERERLNRKGLSPWHWRNEILQGYAITASVALFCIGLFGWVMLPFLLIHHMIGWYTLTQANYVEHYGLKRQKLENGKYEAVQPHHSWNTNHIVSNLVLFHLQRHSDHHANPMRPYQALRNFEELPRLPSGYPGTFALASVPYLWFRVMNPKVMAWAKGDMTRVNSGEI